MNGFMKDRSILLINHRKPTFILSECPRFIFYGILGLLRLRKLEMVSRRFEILRRKLLLF